MRWSLGARWAGPPAPRLDAPLSLERRLAEGGPRRQPRTRPARRAADLPTSRASQAGRLDRARSWTMPTRRRAPRPSIRPVRAVRAASAGAAPLANDLRARLAKPRPGRRRARRAPALRTVPRLCTQARAGARPARSAPRTPAEDGAPWTWSPSSRSRRCFAAFDVWSERRRAVRARSSRCWSSPIYLVRAAAR